MQTRFTGAATLWQDLRYAVRNFRNHPGFTVAAVACMAIGIGANAAIFSFVNAFLFQPIPPAVVMIQRASGNTISFPELQDWQRLNGVFDDVFGYTPGERLTIGHGTGSEHVLGETVSGTYFHALQVSAAAGRMLTPGDESGNVAVLGYQFWRSRFAGDPGIVGKTIWINHQSFLIQGVATRDFHGMLAPWSTDIWVTPYLHADDLRDRRKPWMMAGGRLKAGVTARQAEQAMNSLNLELSRQYPDPGAGQPDRLTVARRGGLSGSPVWFVFTIMAVLLMSVVSIIFLIACANVAGLLIARALVRRREILIRLSLGAGRSRLVRQLLTESLLLALLGATAGIVFAFSAGDALAGFLPHSISGGFRFEHGIDRNVLGYTLALSVASALLSGLWPALRASRQDLGAVGRSQISAASRTPRLRRSLIVGQVAASVVVLATTGMFVESFLRAQKVDLGFDTAHVLMVDINLQDLKYSPTQAGEFYRQLQSRVADLPGVASATLADVLPLGNTRTVNIPGAGEIATAHVDWRYFRSMGIRLLRGREPQPEERDVAVVNDAYVRRFWPGQDPIGKSLVLESGAPVRVVGVTSTARYWSLEEAPRPFVYQIARQFTEPQVSLVVRTQGAAQAMAARVGQQIQSLNEDLPRVAVQTGAERLRTWLEPQRAAAVLLSLLGLAALSLATTGLYALLAQTVAQRAPEIAVRMALGASRRAVAGMLLRQSAFLIALGTTIGLAASAAVARLLASVVGQVNPLGGITLLRVVALLAAVGAAATLVPAYRALRIDPASALRSD